MVNEPTARHSSCDEAAAAKAAIRRVIKETRHSLGSAVDVRLWTKKSPWIALGLAAAAGMAAAVVMRRGGNHAAANGDAMAAAASHPASNAAPSAPSQSGIGAVIASSLFDLAKFGLETAIMNGIRKNGAPSPQPTDYRNETSEAAH